MYRSGLYVTLACLLTASPTFALEHGSLERDGVTLHYTTEGTGKPIVFLSGGPGFDVDYFAPAAKCFPPGYKFVFLEQRGTGRSRFDNMKAETMTMKILVEDLDALRSHLHLERLVMAGHSFGGMLAMAYAADYPQKVEALILIDSGGPTNEFRDWFDDNIHNMGGYFFDRSKAALLHVNPLHTDAFNLINADMAKHYDVRDGMRQLTRSVLIVQGHQDPIGDKTAEDIHHLNPSSTLRYIRKCGHFPWIEQPEELQAILADFLGKQLKP